MPVQSLRPSLVWIMLVAVFLTCRHVPDGHAQGDVTPPAPSEREAPNLPPTPGEEAPSPPAQTEEAPSPPPAPTTGVIYGRVTSTRPPTTGPREGEAPGPIPGGTSVPVAVARVGIAPVSSEHVWWMVTSVDGSFAMRVPAGTYRVTMADDHGMGVARGLPATVTVEAGQQTRLDIHLDTGIRSPGHSQGSAPASRP